MQQLLTAALDVAFFALVGITLFSYLRHRTPIGRDTVLLFASVGVVLLLPIIGAVGAELGWWGRQPDGDADLPPWMSLVGLIFFLAQPFLTLRLIQHFRERTGLVLGIFLLAFLASAVAFVYYSPAVSGARMPIPVTLAVVAYFTLGNLAAAFYFFDEGRRRAGAARVRLFLAGLGSLLFGTAILVVGAGAAVAQQGTTDGGGDASVVSTVGQVLALLAGIAFMFAFIPPRFLRRFWQRSIAYDYLRDLVMDPRGDERILLWDRLTDAARQVTGARASAVAVGSYEAGADIVAADGDWRGGPPIGQHIDGTDLRGVGPFNAIGRRLDNAGPTVLPLVKASGARRVGSIPIATDAGTEGILLLFMARTPLFVEDDLMLLDVLNAHTARAVERQTVLSERTALISQLQLTNAELAHASAAKSDFLAAMSHELRTPLHAIIGFSELLLTGPSGSDDPDESIERPGDPNVREFAGHIHGAGLHLLELINDVLDLAKVEAGKLDLQFQAFDISGLVHRTAKTMRPIAARKRITLEIPDPSGIQIEADAARVRQIVFNLLSNAIKFTPAGGHVEVTLADVGGEVQLTVEDSGPGIAPDDQRRIFEPFEQSWRPDAPRQEGTGLGLALTRQLVEGHGGRIELDSEVGRGSRFTVFLPRATGRALQSSDALRAGSTEPVPDDGRPVILVVEDDPRARELLAINLREAGYAVATAVNGVEALERVRQHHPAAVILDVILPELDGWEVLRELKADAETADIPVIITSVVEDSEIGFALGAADYLIKPVSRETLIAELRRLEVIDGGTPGGLTVLAIDDDVDALALYRAELESAGFRALTADDGELGVRMAREHRPAAILLDLVMPGMDGFAVAAELHGDQITRDTPIIVVTSYDVTAEDKARLNGTVRKVVHKGPGASADLHDWLRRVVQVPEHGQPAAVGAAGGEAARPSSPSEAGNAS